MEEQKPKPSETPGENTHPTSDSWTPPTREEWEAAQRKLINWQETVDRLQGKLKGFEQKLAAQEEEEAKKRGEFEALYKRERETREQYEKRLKQIEASMEEELAAIMKDWDERTKKLIPEGLSVGEKLQMAKGIQDLLSAKKGGPSTTPPGSRNGKDMTDHQSQLDWAYRDPKGYLDWLSKRKE